MKRLAIALLVASCGSDDSTPAQGDAAVDGAGTVDASVDAAAAFTLTSPMVTQGAAIAAVYTCDGANTSPQLVWTGNATSAQSYAIVLADMANGVVHWVIYDIPVAATGLPANVEKAYAPTNVAGAHQTQSYQAAVRGYLGPCPNPADGPHTYEFAVYGLDVATLPGATMATTRAQAIALIQQHQTAMATLSGTYDR